VVICLKQGADSLHIVQLIAFSALTLLVWCWCGYLSEARCRFFAYSPADCLQCLDAVGWAAGRASGL